MSASAKVTVSVTVSDMALILKALRDYDARCHDDARTLSTGPERARAAADGKRARILRRELEG